MRKIYSVLFVCLSAALLSGCTSMSTRLPRADAGSVPQNADFSTEIIGEAEGESSGMRILFIFSIGVERKHGEIEKDHSTLVMGDMPSERFRLRDRVEAAAVYNAIESVPEADALLAPRFSRTRRNYILFARETVTVTGKAVAYTQEEQE